MTGLSTTTIKRVLRGHIRQSDDGFKVADATDLEAIMKAARAEDAKTALAAIATK